MMKRIAFAVAIVALVATAGFAQGPPAPQAPMAPPVPPGMGPGMGMMPGGTTALAVYEGNIYVLDGNMLRRFSANMTEVSAIELDIAPEGPMGGMMGPGMGQQAGPGPRARGGMGQGQGQQGGRMGQGMMGQGRQMGGMMQGQGMMGRGMMMGGAGGPQLAADSTGVYLLHHDTLTRYDHNLNEMTSKEILQRPRMMHQGMGGQGMMQGQRPRGGMQAGEGRHMGGMGQGRGGQHAPIAATRSLDGGEVTLGYLPTPLTTGQVDFRIHVKDIEGDYDEDANASAFLYPSGNVAAGRTMRLQSHRDGRFMGMATILSAGPWELAVRISRPGMADAKVYFPLDVAPG